MSALETLEVRCARAEAEGRRAVAVATRDLREALDRLAEVAEPPDNET